MGAAPVRVEERASPAAGLAGPAIAAVLAFGIPVVFLPRLTDAFILPRAALVVVGAAALLICVLWQARPGAPGLGVLGPIAIPLLGVAGAILLALLTSIAPAVGVVGAYLRNEGAVVQLAYLGLFAGAALLLCTPAHRVRVVTLFLAGCGLIAGEALWQAWRFHVRPDGSTGHPNLLGVLLAMALPLVLLRATRQRRWLLLVVILVPALIASSSRSGWLGAVAGVAALLLLSVDRRWLPVAGLAGAVAAGLLVAALLFSPLRNLSQDTGSARLHIWHDSLGVIAARPLIGWGQETQGLVFGRFVTGDWEPGAVFDRAHSGPLDLMITQGAIGLAAMIAFWVVFWARAFPRRRTEEVRGLLAAWVAYMGWVLLNFDSAPATGPFWLLAGTAWAAVGPPGVAVRRVGTALAAVATATLMLAAVAFAALPVAAETAAWTGTPEAGTRLDPLQPAYHQQLAEKRAASGDAAGAISEFAVAARFGDDDPVMYVEAGDAYRVVGQPGLARRQYQRALQIDPFFQLARDRLAAS